MTWFFSLSLFLFLHFLSLHFFFTLEFLFFFSLSLSFFHSVLYYGVFLSRGVYYLPLSCPVTNYWLTRPCRKRSDSEGESPKIICSFLEPGTAPRKVQARPLSSSTMVIQWVEPETPNGQVTVSFRFRNVFALFVRPIRPDRFPTLPFSSLALSFAGLQDILHDGPESTDGLLEVSDGGQQPADHHLGSGHPHDIHDSSTGVDQRRSRSIEHTCPD